MTIWARALQFEPLGEPIISSSAESGVAALLEGETPSPYLRRKLLETLDRIVTYQHYYKAVYGSYTRIAGRLGVPIPKQVEDAYEIRVVEASGERLLISALSEAGGRISDYVVVDQRYRVRANFPIPSPDSAYLTQAATKHIRAILSMPDGSHLQEKGVFQGYFTFETQKDSKGRPVVNAVGVRSPVDGLRVSSEDLTGQAMQRPESTPEFRTGQREGHDVVGSMQETYLAQRIFRGETGRYAKTWDELSRIAAFHFEDKKAVTGSEGAIPFGDQAIEIDLRASRVPAHESQPQSTILPTGSLVIEPLEN